MDNVYSNFDGLDLSFHGTMPDHTLEILKAAKEEASETRNSVCVDLGGVTCEVRDTGRRGGYAYVFNTGEDGEIWACMGSNERLGRWMLHCSVRSGAFVQYGDLLVIRARLSGRLQAFGFEATRDEKSGLYESIARVDFCLDFVDFSGFELDPVAIVSKGKKAGYLDGATAHWAGRRVTGVTVGRMPNRQVVIYDKTADIAAKGKAYWWRAWGLDPDCGGRVWRIELRAGKKHLRETWGVRSFDDLDRAVADILTDTLHKVRYVELTDSNVTRCPDATLWRSVREALTGWFEGCFNGVTPGVVRETTRVRFSDIMRGLFEGVALTQAAVLSPTISLAEILPHIDAAVDDFKNRLLLEKDESAAKILQVRNRYQLIGESEWKTKRHRPRPDWLPASSA